MAIDLFRAEKWFAAFRLQCLGIMCLFLLGCGSPVNKANSDRIKSGMTEADVDRILGKGKDLSADEVDQVLKKLAEPSPGAPPSPSLAKVEVDLSNLKGVRWGSDKKSITIIYREGRVFKIDPKGL